MHDARSSPCRVGLELPAGRPGDRWRPVGRAGCDRETRREDEDEDEDEGEDALTAAYESGRGCRQRLGGGFDGGAVRGAAGRVMRGREGDRAKYGACVRMLSQWRELWRANVSGCGRTRRVGRRRGGGAGDVASGIAARPRSARRSTWSPGGPWISDGSQRAGARPGGMRI